MSEKPHQPFSVAGKFACNHRKMTITERPVPPQVPLNAVTCALWEQLFTDYTQFEDLRKAKAARGGSGPDFRHLQSKEGLW